MYYKFLSPSRNILAGATRSAALLQHVGGVNTTSAMPLLARQGFKMGLGSPEELALSVSAYSEGFFMVLLVHPEGEVWGFQVP